MAAEWEPGKDELPTFTGDVPEDAVRTERLLWHRFLLFLHRRLSGYAVAFVVAFAVFLVVGLVTPWPDWVDGDPVSMPTEAVLAVAAVVAGAACPVRAVPGPARFVLGAVPGACGVMAGGTANAAWGVYPWADAVGIAGMVLMLAYVLLAGMRVRPWARSRLVQLGQRREQ
ncbi:MAG: hypothetical protein J2P24_08935 [Streptosporangiales bacterium]|nr:hypothetical protein [Streptosporangiales bacterium]MBO0890347.1 hypothetical protein [Acidothermales bacterium]